LRIVPRRPSRWALVTDDRSELTSIRRIKPFSTVKRCPTGSSASTGSRQVAHDLMHFDQDLPGVVLVERNRFHMPINFAPLLCPVGADFFRSVDEAVERPWSLHVGSHEGQGGINVARVENRVGGTEQFSFWCRLVWHKNDFSVETLPRSEYPFARSAHPGSGADAQTSLLKS
jgi:hypothetical protein